MSEGKTLKITVCSNPSTSLVDEETAKKRVEEFDALFKDRYSDKDEEFVATISKPLPPPPCVANFYSRPKRGYHDRSRNRKGDHHGGRGYHGNDRGNRDDYRRRQDHRNDRYHPYGNRHHEDQYRIRHDDRY